MRATTPLFIAWAMLMAGANATGSGHEARSFQGVVASFRVKDRVIKLGDKLTVITVYRNIGTETVTFRFFGPDVDAEIYEKGEREPLLRGCIGTPAPQKVVLQPSESVRFEEPAHLPCWSDLTPGDFEIQFHYHLGLLRDESLQKKYLQMYPHDGYVVAWEDRRHQFTIVK
jgi:hypothetical protein